MRKFFLLFFCLFVATSFFSNVAHAATLAERLSGTILLQVESHGEAWYVEPKTHERWYLGRPHDAFAIMRQHGLGITSANLAKIPQANSDDRGDAKLVKRLSGKILLDVQRNGEAWYVYPKDGHRYYLGRPHDAFAIMRQLSVGITNQNLETVAIAKDSAPVIQALPAPPATPTVPPIVEPSAPTAPSPVSAPADPAVPPSSAVSPATEPVVSSPEVVAPVSENSEPDPAPPVLSQPVSESAIRFLELVNTERQKNGLATLALNTSLMTAAQNHADDMLRRGFFATENPEGEGSSQLAKKAGYETRQSAMLIAEGPATAQDAFDLWKNKEGLPVLLHKNFEDFGLATANSDTSKRPRLRWVVLLASSQTRYEETIKASLSDISALWQAMLDRVNLERSKEGRSTLVMNDLLHTSSQRMADDMLARDFFDHVNPDGVTPHERIVAAGYAARISAENLAVGPTTVEQVMDGWMNSPGHRANILLNGVEEVGFGLSIGRNATGFKVYWVQNFGKR